MGAVRSRSLFHIKGTVGGEGGEEGDGMGGGLLAKGID
jgi:hypothetical protein